MVVREWCVYKHTSPSGKVYIGITSQNPLARWKNGKGYKYNLHFFDAILKYGWDNIKHEILHTGLTAEEAAEKEINLIRKYQSNDARYGYNAADGGFAPTPSKTTRKRLSVATTKQWTTGERPRVRSEEAKRQTSQTLKHLFASGQLVRVISADQKQKIADAHRGRPLSEEHKKNIRESAHRKSVIQYDGDVVVGVFDGVRTAGRETGIDYTGITKVLTGKKRTAGGYIWRYADD